MFQLKRRRFVFGVVAFMVVAGLVVVSCDGAEPTPTNIPPTATPVPATATPVPDYLAELATILEGDNVVQGIIEDFAHEAVQEDVNVKRLGDTAADAEGVAASMYLSFAELEPPEDLRNLHGLARTYLRALVDATRGLDFCVTVLEAQGIGSSAAAGCLNDVVTQFERVDSLGFDLTEELVRASP